MSDNARDLTFDEVEAHEEAGEDFHVPVIMHRTGGPSAKTDNRCGICGARILLTGGNWVPVGERNR